MTRLTQNTIKALLVKLAVSVSAPARLSEVKAALYGGQGRTTDEIKYLAQNKSKLSDAWVTKANIKSTLNEVKNVFMQSKTF